MKSRLLSFVPKAATVTFLSALVSTAPAADIYWAGGDGDLLDPENWLGGSLPTSADVAAISNGATATLAEGDVTFTQFWIGQNGQGSATGSFVQTGGSITLTTGGVVGRQGNAVGNWEMTGGSLTTGDLRLGGGGASSTDPVGSKGTMTVSGADTLVTSTGYVGIGSAGTGTLTLSNSAMWIHNSNAVFLVGGDNNNNPANQAGGTGILTVASGASLTFGGSANLGIGRNTSTAATTGNGTVILDGGEITLGTGTVNLGSRQGASQLAGTGTLTVNSGTLTSNNGIRLNEGTGTINFNGGVAVIGGITKSWGSGTGTVNFNGTVVRASTTSADFFSYNGNQGAGVLNLNIQSGGLKLDTNGNLVVITQSLTGVGGLTKLGEGELVLNGENVYAGGTVVSEGTLVVEAGGTLGTGGIVVENGGILDFDYAFSLTTAGLVLEAGSQFKLDENLTFGGLTIDGTTFAEGVYDYATLKANYGDIFLDGGSGQITVTTAVPEPAALALLLVGGAAAGVFHLRRRMRP